MKYITQDETDQVTMQLWNIFDQTSRDTGRFFEPSNVLMVTVSYNKDKDLFECIVQLENGILYEDGYNALIDNLIFATDVNIQEGQSISRYKSLWVFSIRFYYRFFFRPLYMPYLDTAHTIYDYSLKHGLPLYKVCVSENVHQSVLIEQFDHVIPDFRIVEQRIVNGEIELLIGSVIIVPDEQMDFAAPTGFKFGKGKELQDLFKDMGGDAF